jgi:hypothetical protein
MGPQTDVLAFFLTNGAGDEGGTAERSTLGVVHKPSKRRSRGMLRRLAMAQQARKSRCQSVKAAQSARAGWQHMRVANSAARKNNVVDICRAAAVRCLSSLAQQAWNSGLAECAEGKIFEWCSGASFASWPQTSQQ